MGDLLDFDDSGDNLFKSQDHKMEKSFDDLFGDIQDDHGKSGGTLDDILRPNVGDDIFDSPKSGAKKVVKKKSFRKSKKVERKTADSLFDGVDEEPDIFAASSGQSKKDAPSPEKSHDASHDLLNLSNNKKGPEESHDSLDDLLDSQPPGTVPLCDDLLSIVERATDSAASSTSIPIDLTVLHTEPVNKPVDADELFRAAADKQECDEATTPLEESCDLFSQSEGNRSPEKSHDASHDLLNLSSNRKGLEETHDSLDDLLDSQPPGTVPLCDDLLSIVERATDSAASSTSIPIDLTVLHTEPVNKPVDADELFPAAADKHKTDKTAPPLEESHIISSQSESKKSPEKSHDASHDLLNLSSNRKGVEESHDSLDDLLDSQPPGTVPLCDDLLSIVERATDSAASSTSIPIDLTVLHTEPINKPVDADELFPAAADKQECDEATTPLEESCDLFSQSEGNRSPEKSHDASHDLLNLSSNRKGLEESHDSLDNLLDSQPPGTVPLCDDLLSIVERATDSAASSTSIPIDLTVLHTEPVNKPVDADELFPAAADKHKTDETAPPLEESHIISSQSESKKSPEKSHDASYDLLNLSNNSKGSEESHDSLDDLLDSQPLGTVPSCDDLLSIVERATNPAASSANIPIEHVAKLSQDSPSAERDPVDDLFDNLPEVHNRESDLSEPEDPDLAPAVQQPTLISLPKASEVTKGEHSDSDSEDKGAHSDSEVREDQGRQFDEEIEFADEEAVNERPADTETIVEQPEPVRETKPSPKAKRKTNLKKGKMERSFEDLLTGLSDESEPELDDMIIPGAMDSSNLESILGSPEKPLRSYHQSDMASNPDPSYRDNTPQRRMEEHRGVPAVNMPPEVVVQEPQAEDDGSDSDGDLDDVVMRNKRSTSGSTGEDFDLPEVEDTNHLDVDASKQKGALGKKGSMALRRKPSRKSRKSVMSTGEDAIFQDSTDPKPSAVMNGEDGDDDLSPPSKKPSPAGMIPLHGMMGQPPPLRHLAPSAADDDVTMETKEVKRSSRPPPGAFILPPMGASPGKLQKPAQADCSPAKPGVQQRSPATFDKPALKKVTPKDHQRSRSPEPMEGRYESPALRSVVPGERVKRERSESSERDVSYQTPTLRSAPKPDMRNEEKMDTNSGTFTKPALKSTPKPKMKPRHSETESDDKLDMPKLRSASKESSENNSAESSSQTHTFEKPKLRTTGRKLSPRLDSLESDKSRLDSESVKSFEKPALRATSKDTRSESVSKTPEPTYAFEKPALKSAGKKPYSDGAKSEQFTPGTFEKPALKKATPSPEKELRDPTEPKGLFERPHLRKTDSVSKEPERQTTPDKPSWLQHAADKQHKVLDALHKENQSSNDKSVPSWLDKPPLKKTRPQPLHDSSNNQSSDIMNADSGDDKTPRTRNQSIGSENDPSKPRSGSGSQPERNNYTPSWMRQGRSPSVPTTGVTTSPSGALQSSGSEVVPQWKLELAQRRQNRKEKTPEESSPRRGEETSEPAWKKGIALRKTHQTAATSKETSPVEPEWKKAAEEKRARLRSKSLQYTHLKLT